MITLFAITCIILFVVGVIAIVTFESYYTSDNWCYPCCLKDEVKTREGIVSLKHWIALRLPWAICTWQGRLGSKHYGIHRIGKCPHSVYKRQTFGGGNVNG